MRDTSYTPRLSIEITNDQAKELGIIFPHGMKKAYFSFLIDWTIKMAKIRGVGFLTSIALGHKNMDSEIMAFLLKDYLEENHIDDAFISSLNEIWRKLVNKYEKPFGYVLSENKKHLAQIVEVLENTTREMKE
jgi:phosphopantothenoylcysteine synthetase/decarboxylase